MDWNIVFSAANMFAIAAWAALILLPRWPALLSALLYLGVGLLCLLYTFIIGGLLSGIIPGSEGGDFSSIDGVRTLFSSDPGLTLGWVHYLAFDLFVGLWIARDADSKDFSRILQAPILLATFLFGPVGLGIWLLVREPAARRQGRFS
ncbi:ABA4-like family protein [uncultured Erythrobacter sp.]|uniref:ABA4-like family protein n=1 Tax=uncultured Erythrobacter sp. TaxID=263913 RepID=UPI0026397918|nr:ABA4-like family protein [uncultured Erythrobacter sp.]